MHCNFFLKSLLERANFYQIFKAVRRGFGMTGHSEIHVQIDL